MSSTSSEPRPSVLSSSGSLAIQAQKINQGSGTLPRLRGMAPATRLGTAGKVTTLFGSLNTPVLSSPSSPSPWSMHNSRRPHSRVNDLYSASTGHSTRVDRARVQSRRGSRKTGGQAVVGVGGNVGNGAGQTQLAEADDHLVSSQPSISVICSEKLI